MSESGLQFRGRPVTQKDNETPWRFYSYCGGGGAGFCTEPLGVEGIVLEYRVSKYIVYNRKIVFENSDFFGILIATDGGPDFFCSHSVGSYVDVYMGLAATDSEDLETTAKAGGVVLNGIDDLGALVEFEAPKIPQPFLPARDGGGPNPDWDAKIFVYLWWGNTSYVNGAGDPTAGGAIDARAFNIHKHDNDVKV